jgi:hypothetical protein
MKLSLRHPESRHSLRSLLHQPLAIAVGVALVWVLLVIASDQMWRHAFGFSARDSWALAVGLLAYLALFGGVMVGVIWILSHEHQHYN